MVFLCKLPMWIPLPMIFKLSLEQCCSLYLTCSAYTLPSEWLSEIHYSLSSQQCSRVRIYHPYFESGKLTSWVNWILGRTRIKHNCSDMVLLNYQRQTFSAWLVFHPLPSSTVFLTHLGPEHEVLTMSLFWRVYQRSVTMLDHSSHP